MALCNIHHSRNIDVLRKASHIRDLRFRAAPRASTPYTPLLGCPSTWTRVCIGSSERPPWLFGLHNPRWELWRRTLQAPHRDISKEAAKLCRPTKVHCTRSAKGIANKLKNPSCMKVKFSYKCYHGIGHWLEINQQSIGIVQQFLACLCQEFSSLWADDACVCAMQWWHLAASINSFKI